MATPMDVELSEIRSMAETFTRDQDKQRESVATLRSDAAMYGRPFVSKQVDQILVSADVARMEKEAADELAVLRAARATETAAQKPPIVLAQCNARALAEFFSLFGNTTVDPNASTALPVAFGTQFLGSVMHVPGVVRTGGVQPDTLEAEQARMRSVAQLIASARYVSQTALDSLETCIESVKGASHWRVTNPDMFSATQLEAQMLTPLPNAKPCINAGRCIAVLELPPHKGGVRLPLKRIQRNSAWETFLSTGSWLTEGEMGKSTDMCVPCMLQTYKIAARARQEAGQPCDIRFPLQVRTNCPGGFAPTHVISDSSMPVAWPDVNAHDFVPVERMITYTFHDPVTRVKETRHERVFGYKFRAEVLFDESQYICGADENPMIPPRAALTITTKDVVELTLPAALANNVRVCLAPELPHLSGVEDALPRLAVEFEATVRACMSADQDSANFLNSRFQTFWHAALLRVPSTVLEALGDISTWTINTHAITTALLWRIGLCYTLEKTNMNGNSNLAAFLDAHTALQLAVLRRWTELRHPPSDRELLGDEVARITPESACAVLRLRQQYPVYTAPHMTPKEHYEVRVRLDHRRRTPAMDIVRSSVLPAELVDNAVPTRQQCRAALRWLTEQHDPSVVSGGWLDAASPDSLATLLSRSPRKFHAWLGQAVSLVALQTDFDDSIWLLGCMAERWPWFTYAAAAYTASARLKVPAAAAEALDSGRWAPPSDVVPARRACIPDDAPAWIRHVKGYRRFTAEYHNAADQPVKLGAHLFPDALLNLHGPGSHTNRYLVLGALRCRVYELERICAAHRRVLSKAFEDRMRASRGAANEAHEPPPHPLRYIVGEIRRTLGRKADDDEVEDTPRSPPPLRANASSISAAHRMCSAWPNVDDAVHEAVNVRTQLSESVVIDLMRPLFGDGDIMPDLYEDGPPVLGVPRDTPGREEAYAARCELFAGLELAYHASRAADVSDVFWYTIPEGSPLTPLDQHKPLANGVPCEDSLPDLSQYIGINSLREPSSPSLLSETHGMRSWVRQLATVTYKPCSMRDWAESHSINCAHSEYATWAAQCLLVTALGTYRHACRALPFERAIELYGHLRVQNGETIEGRTKLAHFLKCNAYMTMLAGQEFQMMTIAGAGAESRIMRAAWSSFAYAQECWIPYRAERLRMVLATDSSLESKEHYALNMVRGSGTTGPEPRVFRHMPNTWPLTMLDTFSRIEIERQTEAVINSSDETVSLLPRFVNKVPPEIKHLIAAFFSHTDPQEPLRLEWFARFGVSAHGLALLTMANAVYMVQGDARVVRYLVEQMCDADFFFAWTVMHIMVLHRDTIVLPLPWSMAQRQYLSTQYRVANMKDPAVFTHMTFCHLLGCPGPRSYTVPEADGEHCGAKETELAIDIGKQVCKHNCTFEMFDRLVRRSKESPVQTGLDQMRALRRTMSSTTNAEERNAIQNDISKLREKLATQQAKNVRATATVAFNRPCNEAPARRLLVVGAMVVQRNSVHARSTARVYTACPICGVPTVYSMDRYGANGFTCGKCNIEERWALHGNWCVSCGMVEQGGPLPELIGEAQAAARAARTQHQICGSTSQPRSLRSGASRRRHNDLLRRQDLDDARRADVRRGVMYDIDGREIDTSDTLASPAASLITDSVAERQAEQQKRGPSRRVKERRKNIAVTFEIGRNRTNVHPCAAAMRMHRFTSMPLIDDRPGGLNTTAIFSLCGPCLTRVRHPTVSLTNLLRQSQSEPDEIWINGRRIFTGDKKVGPRVRRHFVPHAPARKRKVSEKGSLVMLDFDEALALEQ